MTAAGCRFQLVESRSTAKLRPALAGKNNTDQIDAVMLANAGRLFDVAAQPVPTPELIAIRRAVLRTHRATVDADRAECRLWAVARAHRVAGPSRPRAGTTCAGSVAASAVTGARSR